MNSLSWLIYAANVVEGLGSFLAFVIIGSIIWIAGAVLYGGMVKDNYHVKFGDEIWQRGHAIQQFAVKKVIWVPVIAMLVAIPIPGKGTIYAIAASESGEQVLKSETGGKAVKALNAWLDRQIKADK